MSMELRGAAVDACASEVGLARRIATRMTFAMRSK
jgi:hypothetical protein